VFAAKQVPFPRLIPGERGSGLFLTASAYLCRGLARRLGGWFFFWLLCLLLRFLRHSHCPQRAGLGLAGGGLAIDQGPGGFIRLLCLEHSGGLCRSGGGGFTGNGHMG